MRVLIAEDDRSLRSALRMVLKDAGHEVFMASTVAEARSTLFPALPDVILVDASIPGDGVALWQELQASTSYRGRAFLMTGDPTTLGALKRRADVFAKPFDYDVLLAQVREVGGGGESPLKEPREGDPRGRRLPSTG